MKKQILEKNLAMFLFFCSVLICFFLYQKKMISFFPTARNQNRSLDTVKEIPFKEKQYKLSGSQFDPLMIKEIVSFEDFEELSGEGELDYSNYLEGKSSLSLSSKNQHISSATVVLKEDTKLGDFNNYKLLVDSRVNPADIGELNLIFSNNDSQKSVGLSIRPESTGWTVITLPKEQFSYIGDTKLRSTSENGLKDDYLFNKIRIELVSRPETVVTVNFDLLLAEKKNDLGEYWLSTTPWSMSWKKIDDGLVFCKLGIGSPVASIKAITSVKNFTIGARFLLLSSNYFGFLIRGNYKDGFGYYVVLDGAETDYWRIFKRGIFDSKNKEVINVSLAEGSFKNFKLELNKWYWLKVIIKNNILKFYFSNDGKDFILISEVKDNSIVSGGVGIVSEGKMILIDDIEFTQ